MRLPCDMSNRCAAADIATDVCTDGQGQGTGGPSVAQVLSASASLYDTLAF